MSIKANVHPHTFDTGQSDAEIQLAEYLASNPSNIQTMAYANRDRRSDDTDVDMLMVTQLELPNFGLYPPVRKPLKYRSKYRSKTPSVHVASDDILLER